MEELPEELRTEPCHVIALVGSNSLHAAIRDVIQKTSAEFRWNVLSLDNETMIARKKDRRLYEGYRPAGIFKAGWIRKHQETVPSVVCLLCEINPDDSEWTEVIARTEAARSRLRNRANCKLVVVLITPRRLEGVSEAEEKMHGLRKRCELDGRALMTLCIAPHDIAPSMQKLDKVLKEHSGNYYREEVKRIKKLKSELSEATQSQLLARHRFKMAYFFEIRKETAQAMKSYEQSYEALRQVHSYLPHHHHPLSYPSSQLKIFGEMIVFKLTVLRLREGQIDAAIRQHQSHLRWQRSLFYPSSEQFPYFHYSSLCRQSLSLARMLESLPKHSLNADTDRYQNPGFHYHVAARAALDRKRSVIQLIEPLRSSSSSSSQLSTYLSAPGAATTLLKVASYDLPRMPTGNLSAVLRPDDLPPLHLLMTCHPSRREVYIGQTYAEADPSSIEGDQSGPLSASIVEVMRYKAMAAELLFDHPAMIIDLLHHAYEHFKRGNNASRTLFHIACLMANEYISSEKHEVAKKFFDRIAVSYRKEKWYSILASILQSCCTCAIKLKQPRDYITYTTELMTDLFPLPLAERQKLFGDVMSFLSGSVASSSPSSLLSLLTPFADETVFDLDQEHPFLSCTVQFDKWTVHVHNDFSLTVRLTTRSPLPLAFSKLQITFSDALHSITKVAEQENAEVCRIEPGRPQSFVFPLNSVEEKDLEVTQVALTLLLPSASSSSVPIIFRFKYSDNRAFKAALTESIEAKRDHSVASSKNDFVERPVIRIIRPLPKAHVSVVHPQPALLNEMYPIDMIIEAKEDHITSGTVRFTNTSFITFFDLDGSTSSITAGILIPEVAAGSTHRISVLARCTSASASHKIAAKIAYATTEYPRLEMDFSEDLDCKSPLAAQYTLTVARKADADGKTLRMATSTQHTLLQGGEEAVNGPTMMDGVVQGYFDQSSASSSSSSSQAQQSSSSSSGAVKLSYPVGEILLLSTGLTCISSHPVVVSNIRFEASRDFSLHGPSDSSPPADADSSSSQHPSGLLTRNETFSSNFRGTLMKASDKMSPGTLVITLSRSTPASATLSSSLQPFQLILAVPSIQVTEAPVSVECHSPKDLVVGRPAILSLVLRNRSALVQDVALTVTDSDSFMYSGMRSGLISLAPEMSRVVSYRLMPTAVGHVNLPQIALSTRRGGEVPIIDASEKWPVFVNPEPLAGAQQ